jgi:hypothetical protein
MIERRKFLGGLALALAAPFVVRTAGLLMPIKRRLAITPLAYGELEEGGVMFDGELFYYDESVWQLQPKTPGKMWAFDSGLVEAPALKCLGVAHAS